MICDAVIRGNFRIAQDTFRMVLECPEIARQAQAGQFVTLPVSYPLDTWRRVFTVYEVNGDQLVIVYRVVGENTKLYSRMRACQKISLAGPFGQPAIIDFTVKRFILVAGGCGLAPLRYIAHAIGETTKARVVIAAGFPTRRHVFNIAGFARCGDCQMAIATDDGSEGFRGTASNLLWEILNAPDGQLPASEETHIFTCGPRPMMKAVSELAAEMGIGCTVLLEAKMACGGMGACLGCTAKTTKGLKQICQDGPCFDAKDVIW